MQVAPFGMQRACDISRYTWAIRNMCARCVPANQNETYALNELCTETEQGNAVNQFCFVDEVLMCMSSHSSDIKTKFVRNCHCIVLLNSSFEVSGSTDIYITVDRIIRSAGFELRSHQSHVGSSLVVRRCRTRMQMQTSCGQMH